MASAMDLDEGMSAEEMWGLVKLVNRELKTTKSNLDAAQQVSMADNNHRVASLQRYCN